MNCLRAVDECFLLYIDFCQIPASERLNWGANSGELCPNRYRYNPAMSNEAIAQQFLELADLTDFVGDSPFKARAYRQAAQVLESLQTPIETLAEGGVDALAALPGIGDAIAEKILAYLQKGTIPKREELLQKVPAGVLEVMAAPGITSAHASASGCCDWWNSSTSRSGARHWGLPSRAGARCSRRLGRWTACSRQCCAALRGACRKMSAT
jgi:hypothetical protein